MADTMKHIFIVFVIALLTACTLLKYQEPTQGPRARVRFVTNTSEITVLRTYDDVNCTVNESEWMRLRDGPFFHGSPKTLGLPLWSYHRNAAKEVYVEANKQINGMFFGEDVDHMVLYRALYQCGVPFYFSFKENTDYEVKFHWSRTQCTAAVSQFVRNGENWSLLELARFDNQINDSNRGCLTQLRRWRFE
jgi:hypothetical protein